MNEMRSQKLMLEPKCPSGHVLVRAVSYLAVSVSRGGKTYPAPDVGNPGTEIKEQEEVRQSADCMFQHAILTRLMPNFSNKLEIWALCPIEWVK